jgi:penicillin-binding protein 1B
MVNAIRERWYAADSSRWQKARAVVAGLLCLIVIVGLAVACKTYWKYSELVASRLSDGMLQPSAQIYAMPDVVTPGYHSTLDQMVTRLRNGGYSEDPANEIGYFTIVGNSLRIYPGSRSRVGGAPVAVDFGAKGIRRIRMLEEKKLAAAFRMEPRLVTSMHDGERAKRRLVRYNEIPQHLRNAVLAIEDHRFFRHGGIDLIRTAKAAYDGLSGWEMPRGTSTLTQQLARGFFLTPDRTYGRKVAELIIALELEERLTKEQIFEYYCNHIPLGQNGSFQISGMGEAADTFFGKDLSDISLAEAALLAGMIQRPSWLNPYRYPERARERRNIVLGAMLRRGFISSAEYEAARRTGITLAPNSVDETEAPYFVDLVDRELREAFSEEDVMTRGLKVYTTLDEDLQQIAVDVAEKGMRAVDAMVKKQSRWRKKQAPSPQVAIVAIDPRTGAVKALLGGRSYAHSQLNRALAQRQPGSCFKPFVYAAALDPLRGMTLASTVTDEATSFQFGDELYEPSNFSEETLGTVTLRKALRHSLNIATVKVSEQTGYDSVAELARRAGMGTKIRATPSLALGTYEVSPLDVAGAYTVLANSGAKVKPHLIDTVEDPDGRVLFRSNTEAIPVLDKRVAYLVTNLLEDVINQGTGYEARARGFLMPAAGKTGTDDDGWFVGYTSNLLCVVWVGFDDNTDLELEGAKSALPIWTEFMKRAVELPAYMDAMPFEMPEGLTTAEIDPDTGGIATSECPARAMEVFIQGTEPIEKCSLHGNGLFRFVAQAWQSLAK